MKGDEYFLKKAVEVGNQRQSPFNFGVVIVKDGEIIAAEIEEVMTQNDPTAHECLVAIRVAEKKLGSYGLEGCIMYCNNEPCVMCFTAAVWARIDRIVYAYTKEDIRMPYEFADISLQELAKKLNRPLQVEQIKVQE